MVVIEAAGGLGNQLQQYAFFRKVQSLGAEARLDLTWFSPEIQETARYRRELELSHLTGISFIPCSKEERARFPLEGGLAGKIKRGWQQVRKTVSGASGSVFTEEKIFHPELLSRIEKDPDKDLYVRGFFACEYYYADLLPVLRKEIGFPLRTDPHLTEKTREKIQTLADMIRTHETVSVHVRRGDYLDEKNREMFGGICTDAYYRKALSHILENAPEAEILVFSDDPEEAGAYIGQMANDAGFGNTRITVADCCRNENSLYDLYLMSLCRHHICANSTFSFWGERLSPFPDGFRIRPEKHKNSQPFVPEDMRRWWKGWTFVSPDGDLTLP